MDEIIHKKGKIYYSIGEVAEMFDVNASLIRFWEKKFDIIKPHKNKKGNRMFTPKDVDNFKLIYHLVKERGMTLAGAQQRLKDNKTGEVHDMEVVDRLLSIRSMLVEIREELKKDGEIFSPEGYLDEEYAEDFATDGTYDAPQATGEVDKPQEEDELIVITEDVTTEIVTDGSSPWDEPNDEMGTGNDGEPTEEDGEPVDETQRSAAMEELRSVKDIIAGWNNISGSPSPNNDVYSSASPTVHDAAIQPAHSDAETQTGSDDTGTKTTGIGGLENIFNDALDMDSSYSDPWEEVGEESPAENAADMFPGDPEADRPKPGDVFGTDTCTTFSPDDSEAGNDGASEKEEPKKPGIYEQTLF